MSTPSTPQPPQPPQPAAPAGDSATRIWTTLDLLKWTTDFFKRKGIESARLETELLLAHVLGCPRIQLYVNFEKPVAPEHLAQFRAAVKRRGEAREPLQYILGVAEFHALKLRVAPGVLIPRPETEQLAAWALGKLKSCTGETLRALDLCTGSGCIALYLAANEPRASIEAVDLSPQALEIARGNAQALQLSERVQFLEGDLCAPLAPADGGPRYDLIVSNPPYIDPAAKPTLQPEVRDHEPALALYAEEAGLELLRRILSEAPAHLKPGGWLGMEFGAGQEEAVRDLCTARGAFGSIEIEKDLNGRMRWLAAQRL